MRSSASSRRWLRLESAVWYGAARSACIKPKIDRKKPSVHRVVGELERHAASLDERALVRRPILDAVFGCVLRMYLRIHSIIVRQLRWAIPASRQDVHQRREPGGSLSCETGALVRIDLTTYNDGNGLAVRDGHAAAAPLSTWSPDRWGLRRLTLVGDMEMGRRESGGLVCRSLW